MTELTGDDRQIMVEAVEDFNDTLVTQSINIAGQGFNNAFRLGCSIMIFPVAIIWIIAIVQGRFDFTTFIVWGTAGAMFSGLFAIFVANRAKELAFEDNYQQNIHPDIEVFLKEHEFTRAQFDMVADEMLAANAPLRAYLGLPADTVAEEVEPDV